MPKLILFGAGHIAKMAHYYFSTDSDYEVVAFTVDRPYIEEESFLGLPVVDFEKMTRAFSPRAYRMFIALSYFRMNRIRAQKYYEAKRLGYDLVSYVSSRCSFLTTEPVGDNCFILEDNTIQPFVKIGNDVILWSGNHIGHESVLGDHCFITSHVVVSGNVRVGAYSFLGVNATLRDSISVAPQTLIGAGAIIMHDTVERGVYVPPRSLLLPKRSDEIDLRAVADEKKANLEKE